MLNNLLTFAQTAVSNDAMAGSESYAMNGGVDPVNPVNTAAVIIGVAGVVALFTIPIVIGMWKMFQKAGRPGWAALIPVYSSVVNYQIVRVSPWWLLLSLPSTVQSGYDYWQLFLNDGATGGGLAPVLSGLFTLLALVGAVIGIWATIRTARAFGRSGWFGLMLLFLPFIGYLMLGFGKEKYQPANIDKKAKVAKTVKKRTAKKL